LVEKGSEEKQKNLLFRTIEYTRANKCFFMVVRAFIYSARFRLELKFLKPERMKKHWGTENEVSLVDEPGEQKEYVLKVAGVVLCVCNNTKWESKCLVRALTAQKLLRKKRINSTLYLGVRQDENSGKMLAHAWLRWGRIVITGGNENLNKFAVVSKFRSI